MNPDSGYPDSGYNWPAFGKIAYEAYREKSGAVLDWDQLSRQTQQAWIESAKVVIDTESEPETASPTEGQAR